MSRAALLLVPLFLFACDREPVAPDSDAGLPEPSFIVNGVPDGAGHPNVGVFLYDSDGNGVIEGAEYGCSDSRISPTVFLTAAHCLVWAPEAARFYVTFDGDLRDGIDGLIAAVGFAHDPRFGHDRAQGWSHAPTVGPLAGFP